MSRSYQPSNGSEGDWFACKFCARCRHYVELPDLGSGAEGCDLDIDLMAMTFDVGESGYPSQWVYDADDQPTCTAFEPFRPGPSPVRPLPGQLELFPEET